jgi:hypothetical protein
MYWNTYRMREALGLSRFEITHTRTSMVWQILTGGVGLLSMLVACVLKPEHGGYAGYVFLLMPVVSLWRQSRRTLQRGLSRRPLRS